MTVPRITDQIRAACWAVAERAQFVKIDLDRIPAYAASLPLEKIAGAELDPAFHFLGRGAETLAFLITLDTINFGSGYFPHLRKRRGRSGYFTIAAALNDYYRQHGPLTVEALSALTAEDCMRIFAQDPDNEPIQELMHHFSKALNDLGRYLKEHFDGSFAALVRAAEASVEKMIRLLIRMPYFRDVHQYGRIKVPFCKRAQLTAADLSLAFNNQGLGRFDDLDHLTIFADNLVPHVLRMDGILQYDAGLVQKIETGVRIPAHSQQEIEIRACALHAVECIKSHMQRSGSTVTSQALDYLLWNRGQQLHYKAVPRHRTRSVFY